MDSICSGFTGSELCERFVQQPFQESRPARTTTTTKTNQPLMGKPKRQVVCVSLTPFLSSHPTLYKPSLVCYFVELAECFVFFVLRNSLVFFGPSCNFTLSLSLQHDFHNKLILK